jgi:anti-sigma regulatory factor (Ser/Thr protein kinase)
VAATTYPYPYDLCSPVASLRLRDDPRAPGRARLVLRDVFSELAAGEETASDGVVMASELVTNAIRHAPGPYEFTICVHEGPLPGEPEAVPDGTCPPAWLMCEVSDGGPPVPLFDRAKAAVRGDPLSAGGRGLPLVLRMSRGHCGIRPLGPGKSVWFAVVVR